MPEEQKDLMGQIGYPSRNFPIRLTEVTPALNLPCAFPWDHRCFVTCSSCYGLDSSLSSEMVLNSTEVEGGVTHWYVPTIRLKGRKHMPFFHLNLFWEIPKFQGNKWDIGRREGNNNVPSQGSFKYLCMFPSKHTAQDFVTETNRKQTRARCAWFFTFQVICLLQLLEEVKSSETNLMCVFMKAVQQKMLFSCIQPDACTPNATPHLKANITSCAAAHLPPVHPRTPVTPYATAVGLTGKRGWAACWA